MAIVCAIVISLLGGAAFLRTRGRQEESDRWRRLRRRAIEDALQRDGAVQSGGRYMASFGDAAALRLFPMPPVEEAGGVEIRSVNAVETARIDRDPIRLRTRDVKGVHAAMRAEAVLCHARAKGVYRQGALAPQQFEILDPDRQVKNPFLRADRAAALRQHIQIDPRPEAHPAAMTAALALFEHHPYPFGDVAAIFCAVRS